MARMDDLGITYWCTLSFIRSHEYDSRTIASLGNGSESNQSRGFLFPTIFPFLVEVILTILVSLEKFQDYIALMLERTTGKSRKGIISQYNIRFLKEIRDKHGNF